MSPRPDAATTTIDKAFDVLFHLNAAPGPVGVSDLGRALGVPKSSVHRLLATLGRRGLVERDDLGRYRLGIGLLQLGLGVLEREPVVEAAGPVLRRLSARFDETCFLVSARAGALLVLDKAEGGGMLRASPRIGAEVPVHATAAGKLYAAFDEKALAGFAPPTADWQRFTDKTPANPGEFAAHAADALRKGFAVNCDEWIDGLSVVAAPIRAASGLWGVLALAASTPRMSALGADDIGATLVAAADEIAEALGARRGGG